MENIVIKAIFVTIGAVSNALVNIWLNRSRIWIGLNRVKQCDSQLVIPKPKFIKLTEKAEYLDSIKESQVTIEQLLDYRDRSKDVLSKNKESRKILSEALDKLSSPLNKNGKKRELLTLLLDNEFFCNRLIDCTIYSIFDFSDKVLQISEDKQVIYGEHFTDPDSSSKKGFIIKKKEKTYKFYLQQEFYDKQTLDDIKAVCKILQYFIQPEIKHIVEKIKKHTEEQIEIFEEIQTELEKTIKVSRKFVIEAHISNLGRQPEQIDSYGLLNIKPDLEKFEPIKVYIQNYQLVEAGVEEINRLTAMTEELLIKQTNDRSKISTVSNSCPVYATINPNQSLLITLKSIDTIEEDFIFDALEKGKLSSQLIMRRTNKNWLKIIEWIPSQELVMGMDLDDERNKKLENYAKEIVLKRKNRWKLIILILAIAIIPPLVVG